MRLIDADTLKQTLKSNCTPELCHDYNTAWCESCCLHNFFEDLIDNAPTVESDYDWGYSEGIHDTERQKGEWLTHRVAFHLTCPFCGCNLRALKNEVFEGDYEYNFCPNCGADMRQEAEE